MATEHQIATSLPASNICDQILPNLFLGSLNALTPPDLLLSLGITHVLSITSSNLDPLPPSLIQLHLRAADTRTQNFLRFVCQGLQFIEDAMTGVIPPADEGKEPRVFVHCRMGISRSASVVVAYLMKHHTYALPVALAYVKHRRPIIHPNQGFQAQLIFLAEAGWDIEALGDLADMAISNPYDAEEEARRTRRHTRPVVEAAPAAPPAPQIQVPIVPPWGDDGVYTDITLLGDGQAFVSRLLHGA